MPIETDDRLSDLLSQGRITVLTLDTNVFDGQRLNLKSAALRAVVGLKDIPFLFLLSDTVFREVKSHMVKGMEDALRAAKKAAGEALFAFDTVSPTRDEMIDKITNGREPSDVAAVRADEFVRASNCEIVDDTSLVDVATLFGAYFDCLPPFSHGKKAEFPDALALYALERAATARDTGFLVVSEDGDWRAFCKKSKRLFLVPKIEKALSLVNGAPLKVRKAVIAWFAHGQDGQAEVGAEILTRVQKLDTDASAHANYGEVETHVWAPEVQSIEWPSSAEIDIIATEEIEPRQLRAVVSVPVVMNLRFSVELSFSVWDSVDRESVGMGGRIIDVDRDEDVHVTATLYLRDVGEECEEIELAEIEMDLASLEIDLGEVDLFETDDDRE